MGWVPLPFSRLAIQNSWPLSRHVWPLSRHVWPFSRHALPFYGTCHLFCFFPLPTLHNLHPGSIFMFIFLPSLRWSGVGKGFFCAALPLPLALGLAPLGCAGILASHHQSSQFPHPFLHCCCFCCSCCWSWTCSPLCLPNHGCKKWCGVSGASARCKQSHNCLAQKIVLNHHRNMQWGTSLPPPWPAGFGWAAGCWAGFCWWPGQAARFDMKNCSD